MTLLELLNELHSRKLLSDLHFDRAILKLIAAHRTQKESMPFYVSFLAGCGAWISAFFTVFFAGALGLRSSESSLFLGVLFLIASISLSRFAATPFFQQFTLAIAFAGNIFVLFGVAGASGTNSPAPLVFAQTILVLTVLPLLPLPAFSFISTLLLAFLAAMWVSQNETLEAFHLLVLIEVMITGTIIYSEYRLAFLVPVSYSILLSLACTILFMELEYSKAAVIFGEKNSDFSLLPSNLVLTAALVCIILMAAGSPARAKEPFIAVSLGAAFLLGFLTNPGILLVLALLVLGFTYDNRFISSLAFIFTPVFLFTYYYSLRIPLSYKSWVLVASGIFLLLLRHILQQVLKLPFYTEKHAGEKSEEIV